MSRISRTVPVLAVAVMSLFAAGCGSSGGENASCLSCHGKIEHASPAHPSCVACHGGEGRARSREDAHRTMFAPRNPSDPAVWEKSCGACHPYQLGRVRSGLMYTNTGIIRNIQLTWEGEDGRRYGARQDDLYDAEGKRVRVSGVAELDNLSGELYRKFCSLCHVGTENRYAWGVGHGSGCAACHFPRNADSAYKGSDLTMRLRGPAASSHRMEGLPGNDACFRCHNRSGRIALSYLGLNDGNNGLVPTRGGFPGPQLTSGNRNVTSIPPDIHHARGMECIDCHTSRDIMGDGYAYENLYHQVEIRCEDCHGSATSPPRWREIARENEEPVRESARYPMQMRPGMRMIVTAKGRPYSNVFVKDGRVAVLGKRSGRVFTSKVITGSPAHTVVGHGRLECTACHSRAVPQCYGCHTKYDKGRTGTDFISGLDTPGLFTETEDYRTLYPFPLALNQRGGIAPVTPGCQTFVTVVEADGTLSREGYVSTFKGKRQLRFAPFYSHNTGERAIGCGECHANPAFLGFGQHVTGKGRIDGTLRCTKNEEKPLDGFQTMEGGLVRAFSAITRENSRPLNDTEAKRVWRANLCIVCHTRADDPIYRKELDYRALDDALHRRLLAGSAGRVVAR
ncbi:selenite/tellurite reduction operon c-type cytochrome ExtM [Geobacter anodireducens]|uniref:Cytochrome c3 family protein n=1 Tax=Geobacter anodireducens TaxID=1340425 RepID=A0ABR9NTT0_9BACT|nr:selenite/tellurite reduction operon c-type cytochrome ExtM [Geobacter anodireducens]MBE2887673.1 cytochrome c3 family protein [Geobacter anodireducens]HMN02945.1 selenite/tellurite reduction operon c-type cytochrome ExtM [Geobacter anodireducens]